MGREGKGKRANECSDKVREDVNEAVKKKGIIWRKLSSRLCEQLCTFELNSSKATGFIGLAMDQASHRSGRPRKPRSRGKPRRANEDGEGEGGGSFRRDGQPAAGYLERGRDWRSMGEEEARQALKAIGETRFSAFDAGESSEAKRWIEDGVDEIVKTSTTDDLKQQLERRRLFLTATQNLLFHKRDLVDTDWFKKVSPSMFAKLLPSLLSLLREVSSTGDYESIMKPYLIEILKTLESVVYNQTEQNRFSPKLSAFA
eukprot:461863-Hanusia_phi.AAC.5